MKTLDEEGKALVEAKCCVVCKHCFYTGLHSFGGLPVIFVPAQATFSLVAGIVEGLKCGCKVLFCLPPVAVCHYLIKHNIKRKSFFCKGKKKIHIKEGFAATKTKAINFSALNTVLKKLYCLINIELAGITVYKTMRAMQITGCGRGKNNFVWGKSFIVHKHIIINF